jgi:hypothetical protein
LCENQSDVSISDTIIHHEVLEAARD